MHANHTPGPWALDNPASLIVRAPARNAAGQRIADCRALLPDAELRANAALIAAAPDLLSALREIVAEWDTRHADEDHRTGYTLDTGGIAQARAAIARATGADHA